MNVKLIRVALLPAVTFGVLLYNGVPFCVTLERPWKNNQKNISCIPVGTYLCTRIKSAKFGKTFLVTEVPGRSEILFHKGNIDDDTHGCIILGECYQPLGNKLAVQSSGLAMLEFLSITNKVNEFLLEVVNA